MKKADIQTMTNEDVLCELLFNQIRMTKEANSRRGTTKQTEKEEEWLLEEMFKRFDIDEEKFQELFRRV